MAQYLSRPLTSFIRRHGLTKQKLWLLAAVILLGLSCGIAWRFRSSLASMVAGLPLFSTGVSAQIIDDGSGEKVAGGKKTQAAGTSEAQQESSRAAELVMVHVAGAVKKPGVYSLSSQKPRVQDGIDQAGGLLEGADVTNINLAELVEDGSKIYVPKKGEEPRFDAAAVPVPTPLGQLPATAQGSAQRASRGRASQTGRAQKPVNINTATEEQLMTLPGIGQSTARRIIQDRKEHGKFSSPKDLMRISGIGEKKFAKLQGKIRV